MMKLKGGGTYIRDEACDDGECDPNECEEYCEEEAE